MTGRKSILKERSFSFAIDCIRIYKSLVDSHKEYVISRQLLRSGTSVGANIREAFNGESKADFIHKLGIAQKECDETLYWLELLHQSEYMNNPDYGIISTKAIELLKIIKSSILTSKSHIP